MPDSPTHSIEIPQSPNPNNPNPNPNPNCDPPENNPDDKSQDLTQEIQNPSPKSPFNNTQKTPDQDSNPVEKKSNLLLDLNPENQQKKQDFDDLDQDNQEDDDDDDEEGINMSISPFPITVINAKNGKTNRRNPKRKKGNLNRPVSFSKRRKIEMLSKCFKPIPFVPVNVIEFSRFEEELRKLNLWEFACIELDRNIRSDLVVQLVADYKPKAKVRSFNVNGWKIKVTRPDLARALKLPTKKPSPDFCQGECFSKEFISFLEEFVSRTMLLCDCDVWVTPSEVVSVLKLIKDGEPMRVDWAGIIWYLVEEELKKGTGLTNCYYASHLQQLIKDQKAELLDEESEEVEEVIVEDDDEEGDTEVLDAQESSLGEETGVAQGETVGASDVMEMETEVEKEIEMEKEKVGCSDVVLKDGGDTDMVEKADDNDNVTEMGGDGDDSELKKVGEIDDGEKNENNVESIGCLDEVENVENIDGVERAENVETSEGVGVEDLLDGPQRWPLSGLQRCSRAAIPMSIDGIGDDVEDETAEDVDDEQGFNFMEKSHMDLNEMASRNCIQDIEIGHLSYNSVEHGGQSSLGLMPPRVENEVMFNHVGKREFDHEHDFSHHALDDNHKRMRLDEDWGHKPSDSITSLEELIQSAQKTKMILESEKFQQANLLEVYNNQLEVHKNEVELWRRKFDDLQMKSNAEISRRDRELHLMNSVIDGYRRAMKDTQRVFAEYRKRCRIPDEPIYKDVGNGGVVKSIMELEKERVKKEEEDKRTRFVLQNTYNTRIDRFETQFNELCERLMSLDERLFNASKEVEQVKDEVVKRKMSEKVEMSQEVQSEAQVPQKDGIVEPEMSENDAMLEEASKEAEEAAKDDIAELKVSEKAVKPEEAAKDDTVELKVSVKAVMPEEVESSSSE